MFVTFCVSKIELTITYYFLSIHKFSQIMARYIDIDDIDIDIDIDIDR